MADRDTARSRDTDRRLPLTFRWFSGKNQPAVGPQEVVWWEDEANQTAKILMRRSRATYVFGSIPQEAGEPPTEGVNSLGGLTPTRGSLIVGNATPQWTSLTLGASGTVLFSNGTDAAWSSLVTAGIAPTTRLLTAGAGLTGGGDLSLDRSFAVGAGTGITVNADDVALTVPVSAVNGGTGQTAVIAGNLLYGSAPNTWSRRTIGNPGDVLTVSSGVPTWLPPATSGTVTGNGSANQISKWNDTFTIQDSSITDDGAKTENTLPAFFDQWIDLIAISTPPPPSINHLQLFARLNGGFIDFVAQSNGQEFIFASLINTTHTNTMLFNGIE